MIKNAATAAIVSVANVDLELATTSLVIDPVDSLNERSPFDGASSKLPPVR
jgi:hypothetical protein